MGLFNLFKKKTQETLPPFESNADEFSRDEIDALLKKCLANPHHTPEAKNDAYTANLIHSLCDNKDVTLVNESVSNGMKIFNFNVERSNGPDYVSISYAESNPLVVFITSAPYPFAGDSISFNKYCNSLNLMFPFLQVGAKDFERTIALPDPDNAGQISDQSYMEPAYAVRVVLPLLNYESDGNNLLTCLRCVPIYGYDLRDGYHSNDLQPYANRRTGINIQLQKIIDIHAGMKDVVPAMVAITGDMSSSAHIDNSAVSKIELLSCSYFQETEYGFMGIYENTPITLEFHQLFPTLWSFSYNCKIKMDNQEELDSLISNIGEFSFPCDGSDNEITCIRKSPISEITEDNEVCYIPSFTFCIPNKMDIKLIVHQLAEVMTYANLTEKDFHPETEK